MGWFVWDRDHHGPIEVRRISCSDEALADEAAPPATNDADAPATVADYKWPDIPEFLRRSAS